MVAALILEQVAQTSQRKHDVGLWDVGVSQLAKQDRQIMRASVTATITFAGVGVQQEDAVEIETWEEFFVRELKEPFDDVDGCRAD